MYVNKIFPCFFITFFGRVLDDSTLKIAEITCHIHAIFPVEFISIHAHALLTYVANFTVYVCVCLCVLELQTLPALTKGSQLLERATAPALYPSEVDPLPRRHSRAAVGICATLLSVWFQRAILTLMLK